MKKIYSIAGNSCDKGNLSLKNYSKSKLAIKKLKKIEFFCL